MELARFLSAINHFGQIGAGKLKKKFAKYGSNWQNDEHGR